MPGLVDDLRGHREQYYVGRLEYGRGDGFGVEERFHGRRPRDTFLVPADFVEFGDPPRRMSVYARLVDWDNYIRVEFFGDGTCRIIEKSGGTATVTDTGTAASTTNANELTSMTDPNGTTSFAFDAWGRMTSKERGSYRAEYGFRYGQMLHSLDSNFPAEDNVVFAYGGDGQRRQRSFATATSNYRLDESGVARNEQDNLGNLTHTFVGGFAYVQGTDPASGSYRYCHTDLIGSTRRVTDGASVTAAGEYTPYGQAYFRCGSNHSWSYATLSDDPPSGLQFARARYYSVPISRWLTRDPAGNLNLYGYVSGNPVNYIDPLGQDGESAGLGFGPARLVPLNCNGELRELRRGTLEREMSPGKPLPQGVRRDLDRGCIGLTAAYQGCGQDRPELAPDTQCYRRRAKAKARKCSGDKRNFTFGVHGVWKDNSAPAPNPQTGHIPNDSIVVGTGDFNYIACFPETDTFAWMNHAGQGGVGAQRAYLAPAPPSPKAYWGEMWCSTCIKKH